MRKPVKKPCKTCEAIRKALALRLSKISKGSKK